ncbi:MAG: two-CW domain-containing protein, partial [Polyangia bacterium]
MRIKRARPLPSVAEARFRSTDTELRLIAAAMIGERSIPKGRRRTPGEVRGTSARHCRSTIRGTPLDQVVGARHAHLAMMEPSLGENAQNPRRRLEVVEPERMNCWEFKQCGREPGGARTGELGVCPASVCAECDGINGGRQGGRVCWAIAGTLCGGQVRGTFAQKRLACTQCDFLQQVEQDMGFSFHLVPTWHRLEEVIRAEEERHRSFFDGVPVGLYRCSPAGEFLDVNPALVKLLGHRNREALLGFTMAGLSVDAEASSRRAKVVQSEGQLRDFEMRLRRGDGTVFWARESSHLVVDETGTPLYREGILQDITERKMAEEQARAREVVAAANQALLEQFREIASIVDAVNAIVYVSDFDTYEVLYVNRYATELFGDCLGKRCYQALQFGQDGPCSFCTNGRLLVDGKPGPPVVWESQNTRTKRWYLCIDKAVPWLDGRLVRMEAAVDITERKRAEETANFLAEVSKVLAGSLDYPATLSQVARLAVPRLADWCIIELVGDDGCLRPVEVACADPAQTRSAASWRDGACARQESLCMRVLSSGHAELLSEISDEQLAAAACNPEQVAALRRIAARSLLAAPLLTQGRTLGVLTLIAAESQRRYDHTDLALAEEVGRRAALAIANARLYEAAQKAIHAREDVLAVVSHDLKNPLGV